ncbi:BrnT family toxin [candidate division KSB1 bacterium]|nr:BrnT family toxin [candidate division KSB1 bacterium]
MANWQRFKPTDFEYDFDRDELAAHRVTFEEAVECFFSGFEVRRNKSYRDRYQLVGRSFGGRRLKIIFQLNPKNVVRIITGWPI